MKKRLYPKTKSFHHLAISLKPSTFYSLKAIAAMHKMSMKRFIENSLEEIWRKRHSLQTLY